MKAKNFLCLAVSKDGNWIAAGTTESVVFVWDAKTYKQKYVFKADSWVKGVDFSPDSTQLVAASLSFTVTIWNIATGEEVRTLHHERSVQAATYSPQGDRIATLTDKHVRVWDSEDGRVLNEIHVEYHAGLFWSDDSLVLVSGNKIKKIEGSTVVSEWSVPDGNKDSRIALQDKGEFISCSTELTVTFWDASTHSHLGLIQCHQSIRSNALSSDDRFVAIIEGHKRITIKQLSYIWVSVVFRWIIVDFNFLSPLKFAFPGRFD